MPKSIGFGLERLGYLSLAYPKTILVFTALLYVAMSAFAAQLKFESDSRAIFRSNNVEFTQFEAFSKRYPGFLNETLVLIEGDSLFEPKTLDALRGLHLDLELTDNVLRVVSIFSARHPPVGADDTGRPIVPRKLDGTTNTSQLRRDISIHPVVKDKLISKDGDGLLFIVTFDDAMADVGRAEKILADLEETVTETLEGIDAKASLTGLPVFRTEIISSLQRDQAMFIALGLLIGTLLSYLFFRKLKYVFIVSLPGSIVISTLLGSMWLAGQNINVLTSMITPLVTVITLSNALHLTFSIRRSLIAGSELENAIRTAIRETGPGCVLSCLTTAVALLTLVVSPLPLISNFGFVAVGGTLLALFGTMLVLPALAYAILTRWPSHEKSDAAENWLASRITGMCGGVARAVSWAPSTIAAVSVIAVILLGAVHAQNQPRYTTAENLPASSKASVTLEKIDQHFAGISRVRLFLEWPEGQSLLSPDTLKAVQEAHAIVASMPWIRTAWSLDSIVDWLQSDDMTLATAIKFIEKNRETFEGDLFDPVSNSTVITGYFPDTNSVEMIAKLKVLETKLGALAKRWPGMTPTLAGSSRLEAVTNTEIISTLNRSLMMAIAIIIALIAIAMRSLKAGLVSIVPNLLPIAAGGTFLYLSGYGLQMTSVVAFTVGFGMAVDSTIHFLNRFRQVRENEPDAITAVSATLNSVGPVLIISTLVMIAGLSTTLISDLPMVQLYGKVSILVLTAALVADLIVLPAILAAWSTPNRR